MKKKLLFTLLAILTVFAVFAGATPEISQEILDSIKNQNVVTGILDNSQQSSALPILTSQNSGNTAIIDRDMATLTRLYKTVEKNYLYDIDHDAVFNAMATAMFEALDDKYSQFVPPVEKEDFDEQTTGSFGGIGILFSKPDDMILIEQVYANTPAATAGLAARDKITHIDGTDIAEVDINDCKTMMRGEVGTKVVLTILRNGTSFDVTLSRAIISTPAVDYTMIENGIGYIIISAFYSNTPDEVSSALKDLQAKGMKSLILDLRECPGGDVDATLEIADMFISDSELLKVSFKDSSRNVVYWANNSILVDPSVKIAILVDGGTASSAEILSSTMRDNNRATIIGEKTFGKGIMQAVSQFGDSEYKLTIANYFPPSGYQIHENGIIPDIEVESITVGEDQIDAYNNLYNSTLITDFVEQHPEYTKENIELFVMQNPDLNLDDLAVKCLVRNQYLVKMPYDERPIVDTMYDLDVIAAIEFLEK